MRLALLFALLTTAACSGQDSSSGDNQDLGVDAAPQQDTAQRPDAGPELASEVTLDLPWEELPTLPPGKSFSTRYAAGAAQMVLNPDHSVFLGGFGLCQGNADNCRYSEGIHDDLYVSALALADTVTGEVVVFVGADSVGLLLHDQRLIHEAAPAAFQQRFGVKMEGQRLVVGHSHTHHAPDTVGLYGTMLEPQREEEAYIASLRQAAVEMALEAYGNLEQAELTWGKGTAPSTSLDTCAEDMDVWTVAARKPGGGDYIGTLTRWAAHPTAYWIESNSISADFVGSFRKRMQENTGAPAVYLNGPIGSVYPEKPEGCNETDAFPDGWQDPDLSAEDHSTVTCIGYNLADQALQSLAQPTPVGDQGLAFKHKIFQFHPTSLILMMVIDTPSVPGDGVDVKDPESRWTAEFSWVRLGELNFLSTPGEAFPCLAKNISNLMASKGHNNTIVLSVTQDWMGYLLAKEQFNEPAVKYQSGMSPGDTVEAAYLEALGELLAP